MSAGKELRALVADLRDPNSKLRTDRAVAAALEVIIDRYFTSEGGGVTERERFELWWDDPENVDGGVIAATAWAAWKAAVTEG